MVEKQLSDIYLNTDKVTTQLFGQIGTESLKPLQAQESDNWSIIIINS